jgi:hypothetical protein
MAVTIVATAGAADANSFVTLAEAESYILGRLNVSLWDAATDDTKNRALVEATHELNALYWIGKRASSTQSLAWPRDWAVDPDDPNGDYYAATEIPARLKWATEELALQFVKAGTTDVAAQDSTAGIIRKKIDVLETEYAPFGRAEGLDRYPRVVNYIRPLLDGGSSGLMTQVVRG